MNNLIISFIQADLKWENTKANLSNFDKLLTRCDTDSDVIILPEMFTTGFSMKSAHLAEGMDGQSVNWMRLNAKKYNSAIVGSLIIQENYHFYNRLIWMNPDGSNFSYDKKYLFSLANEDEHYTAGSKKLVVDYKGWKICPMICYDLRFPEWARNTENYDLLLYVANWPKTRIIHWCALLRARAIENQCYVIGVNRVGTDGIGLEYSGYSSLYNYNGDKIIEEIGSDEVKIEKLDYSSLQEFRKKLPFLKDQTN